MRHLRYFVAVAEALSFRRAAERLRVAQPALSKQIKNLEEEIGAKLLHRNTAGVALTDAGAVLLEDARDILERVDMATSAARDAASGRSGRLTIGNFGVVSASFLPSALAEFRARYPEVEVNLKDMALPDQITALKSGIIQVGFFLDNGTTKLPAEMECSEILTARISVAVGADHRLARATSISLADLEEETILCIGESTGNNTHRLKMEELFASRGHRHRPLKSVSSFESLVAMIAGEHGVSLIIPNFAQRNADPVVFRRLREEGSDLVVHLNVVWNRGVGSQLARNFVEVVKKRKRSYS